MESIIGSIISAGSQSVQNALNRSFEREEAEKQRRWNEEQADKANAWNLEQWNRENEYNSASAQVQRMRDAGLNPLYYGLDGSSASGQPAATTLGYERASMPSAPNPFSIFGSLPLQIAQVDKMRAETAKVNNENETETISRQKLLQDIETAKQELELKKSQVGLTDAQRKDIEVRLSWIDRLNQAALEEKQASTALSNSQKKRIEELLEGEKLLQSKTVEDFDHRWRKISAEFTKLSKESGLLEKDIENYALNHMQSGFMGTGLSVVNFFRSVMHKPEMSEEELAQYYENQKQLGDATSHVVGNKY